MPEQTATPVPPRRRYRTVLRAVAFGLGIPVGLVAVALGMVLVAGNTGIGQREIERRLPGLTGGSVHLSGLGGRFPDALHVRHLELDDYRGAWLSIDDLQLDWSPLRLLTRQAVISNLSMARLSIPRLSEDDPAHPPKPEKESGESIHMGVSIHAVNVARIEVGAPIARIPAAFSLNGHASLADIAPVLDHFSVATLPPADIALKLTRLDHPGSLDLDTRLDRRTVSLNLHAHEDAQGFLSTLTQLPALAPLDLTLGLHGPRDQAELALALTTGAVKAGANGQVGLIDRHMALDVTASSTDLVAGSGLSWQGASLKAHLGGTLNRPKGNGVFDIDRLTTDTAGFTSLHMVADGLSGQENGQPEHAAIHATLTGLRIPGSQPTLFAGEPVRLDLMWHPDATGGPVDLTLSHPLVQLAGRIMTAGEMAATFHADLPDLAPLAAAGGTKLHGHAGLSGNVTLPGKGHDGRFGLDSKVVLDGGLPIAVGLIGDKGQLNAAGTISRDRHGTNTITFTSLAVQGSTLQLDAPQLRLVTGTPLRVDADAHLGLSDLHVLAPTLHGKMQADLHAAGPVDDLMASVKTQASIAAGNTVAGDMQASASMAHLPQVKQGALDISGTLDRAPIAVSARLDSNADDSRHMQVEHLGWKSLTGQADMTLPAGHVVPSGTLDLHMTRLADLHELTGQDINGHLSATVRTTAATATAPAELDVNVDSALGAAMARVDRLVLRGRVLDPVGTPTTDLDLVVDNAHFRDMGGHGHVTAKGPISGLNITAQSGVDTPWTGAATLDTALLANVPGHSVTVHRLAAEARHEQVRLDAPVSVTYGKETAIDHLRATITPPHGQAGNVEASGRIAPTLDLHASITRLSPDLLTPFIANLQAQGMLSADARLTGTTTNPSGKVSVHGTDLKYHTDYTSSLAPASLDATANLNAGMAQVDARLQAGTQVNLSLRGTAPVNRTGQLNLQADGNLDLAVANAYLGAQGMQAGGNLQMGIGMRGTLGQPRMSGTLTLANGLFHDFGQGIQLSAMRGTVNAMGDRLVISSLTAQAGKGTLAASGSYGVLQPGQPIDLHIHADNARPLASDLITATLDGDLGVKGLLSSRIDATGDITLKQVDINIPDSLPTSVAHLNVIRPEDEKNAQTVVHTSPLVVGLGLDVRSPGRFYVRGHGLNTEMHGRIHTGGTATAPVVTGAFSLVKGGFSLGGISLDFSKGQVGFNGVGVTHAIDPTLDFVAERSTNDGTARLNVGGYASAPKITFSSSPPLSQDQILAILLFGTDSQSLSATQMASIAAAVATLSGGSAFDPLGMVRKTLHLDRLQMSSSSNGSGGNDTGAIEAGKYVMRGVYVGAKQATSGSGTQAQVQVDLTKRLKINTTVGTGGNVTGFTTPENDPGSSIGLLYQFKY